MDLESKNKLPLAGRHIFIYFSIFILMKSPHTFKLTYAAGYKIYFSFLFLRIIYLGAGQDWR